MNSHVPRIPKILFQIFNISFPWEFKGAKKNSINECPIGISQKCIYCFDQPWKCKEKKPKYDELLKKKKKKGINAFLVPIF